MSKNGNSKQKPEKIFKAGAVSVSIFRSEGEYGAYRTCSCSVRYKKGDNWEYGQFMKASDAIVAAALLEDARKYMMMKDDQENTGRPPRQQRERKTARNDDAVPAGRVRDGDDDGDNEAPF